MKTQTSNKLNTLLVAIVMLLVFVAGARALGGTNSWLTDENKVKLQLSVVGIDIAVKQGSREVTNGESIYLDASYIEAKTYDIEDVKTTNNEEGDGYYIRFQVLAVVNGTSYNINSNVTTDYNTTNGNTVTNFYSSGEWLYYRGGASGSTPVQMSSNQTQSILTSVTIPTTLGSVNIAELQGKHVRLYLYIEGSPSSNFNV